MSELGTYGSTIAPFYPDNVIPEPGDPITWDWLDVCGQFSQRYLKMATVVATISNLGNYVFDYSKLRCDFFPPFIQVHLRRFDPGSQTFGSTWERYDPRDDFVTYTVDVSLYARVSTYDIIEVGLGSCKIVNKMNQARAFRIQAYL